MLLSWIFAGVIGFIATLEVIDLSQPKAAETYYNPHQAERDARPSTEELPNE